MTSGSDDISLVFSRVAIADKRRDDICLTIRTKLDIVHVAGVRPTRCNDGEDQNNDTGVEWKWSPERCSVETDQTRRGLCQIDLMPHHATKG